ncbi:hypothetical protein FHS40_008876 [Streptomyces spectabilis]|uniref:Uncharacterized protein n=1 Tax=Streptomyces spectabilis TaxID=68270 RepID=A0A7W8B4V7_STRST|nr:hypothetical protein [Streptomyces spectabilis]
MAPVKTPTSRPRSARGSRKASSKASQPVSRSSRCWGPIAVASAGESPKKAASNAPASGRKPPCRVQLVPRDAGSGSYSASRFQPRSVGKETMASVPERTSLHRSPRDRTLPGYRQPIPMIAMGSADACPIGTAAGSGCLRSSASRWSARSDGVGCSKANVVGSASPVARARRLRSSTEASESNDWSRNGTAGLIPSESLCPSTCAACSHTSARSNARRSSCGAASSPAAADPCPTGAERVQTPHRPGR